MTAAKTVVGFEPRRPQAYTGVWAGLEKDRQMIKWLYDNGAGGAMWWAINDKQMSDGATCGENAQEEAAYAASLEEEQDADCAGIEVQPITDEP